MAQQPFHHGWSAGLVPQGFLARRGLGLIDAYGVPKAAFHAFARVAPVALLATDEGLNGVLLHAVNERASTLEATLYRHAVSRRRGGGGAHQRPLTLLPRTVQAIAVDGMLERFHDSTCAYRFGPPQHDLLSATLTVGGEVLARAFHEPLGHGRALELDLGLTGYLTRRDGLTFAVAAHAAFCPARDLDIDDHLPVDDCFHLSPGEERWVQLRPQGAPEGAPRGRVAALNTLAVGTLTFTDSIP